MSTPIDIYVGDVRDRLRDLPSDHYDCVVTSPPYWGLRDYQTGEWVGGDPDCDHTRGNARPDHSGSGAGFLGTRGEQDSAAAGATPMGQVCTRCGARREDAQIGLEPTLSEHIAVLVDVFEEVRRVLKPTGTFWLNYGDCYATTPNGRPADEVRLLGGDDRTFRDKPISTVGGGGKRAGRNLGNVAGDGVRRVVAGDLVKPKDLLMIPNRLAIALQDAGWWVRAECIWGKPNAMPDSSGSQRPSAAHEKVFLLTKSADAAVWRARDTGELSFNPDLSQRCPLITDPSREGHRWVCIGSYYDANAVLQGRTSDEDAVTYRGGSYTEGEPGPRKVSGNRRVKMPDGWDTGPGGHGSFHRQEREKGRRNKQAETAEVAASTGNASARRMDGFNTKWDAQEKTRAVDVASPRHAGHINNTGIEDVPRGEGRFLRNYEPAPLTVWDIAVAPFKGKHFATFPPELVARCIRAGCPEGGRVLDPFGGAGTTALVGWRLRCPTTLIELSAEYAEIARVRLSAEQGIWADIRVHEPQDLAETAA